MTKHIVTALVGFLGMGLALALWHGYQDHANWHGLLNLMQQNAQRQQAPPPGAAPKVP